MLCKVSVSQINSFCRKRNIILIDNLMRSSSKNYLKGYFHCFDPFPKYSDVGEAMCFFLERKAMFREEQINI